MMWKKKSRKFFINEDDARDLLEHGYALKVKRMNYYQFRIRHEENNDYFWDWYHTQGTVVINHKGSNSRWGTWGDAEDLAKAIEKFIREKI